MKSYVDPYGINPIGAETGYFAGSESDVPSDENMTGRWGDGMPPSNYYALALSKQKFGTISEASTRVAMKEGWRMWRHDLDAKAKAEAALGKPNSGAPTQSPEMPGLKYIVSSAAGAPMPVSIGRRIIAGNIIDCSELEPRLIGYRVWYEDTVVYPENDWWNPPE